ncbi:hypothetical protein [Saccharomonospora viridis]|uniref:hypothetical protein n=1 Tax=Saccharomonospora viridis TaxID=1852 RepID=UPI0011809B6D|nr:hypothetical protein [Saccharomonospora viridis]
MTYPPQPGQPPYDQQPGGQYGVPPSGGFPQQSGGQYPAIPGYPQGQYPHGPQGGFGPQPPKKSKTGLWVGLGIGAVAVVVFVITAFVAPGFLLSDDDDDSTSANSGGNSSGAQALAEKVHNGLIADDTATLQQLACPDATEMVHKAIEHSWEVGDIRINGWIQENGDTAMVKATVTITEKNREADIINTFAKKDGDWCWKNVTIEPARASGSNEMSDIPPLPSNPSVPNYPGSADGAGLSEVKADTEALLHAIGNLVNAGDTDGLRRSLCPGRESEMEDYEEAISNGETFHLTGVEEPRVTTSIDDPTEQVTQVDAIFLNSTGDRELVLFVYDGSCVFLVSYQEPLNQG